MPVRPTAWLGAALSLVVVGNGVALWTVDGGTDPARPGTKVEGTQVVRGINDGAAAPAGAAVFAIQGDIAGLHPGLHGVGLRVTVRNDNDFPIVVERLSATVAAVVGGEGDCPVSVEGRPSLVVEPFAGSLPVAANGSATGTLAVSMDAAVPDECSGATFHLSYNGQGTGQ